jgi:hypothetical protein
MNIAERRSVEKIPRISFPLSTYLAPTFLLAPAAPNLNLVLHFTQMHSHIPLAGSAIEVVSVEGVFGTATLLVNRENVSPRRVPPIFWTSFKIRDRNYESKHLGIGL